MTRQHHTPAPAVIHTDEDKRNACEISTKGNTRQSARDNSGSALLKTAMTKQAQVQKSPEDVCT